MRRLYIITADLSSASRGGEGGALKSKKGIFQTMGKGNRTRNDQYESAYEMSGSGAAVKAKTGPKKDKTATFVLIAIVALLALSLVLVIFSGSGVKDRNTMIVSSENFEVNGAMLPYFENLAYSNTFNQYFNLYYMYLYPNDVNSAYNAAVSQMSGLTLDDFFDSALTTAKELLVLCEAARAEGMTLGDEENAIIEEALASFDGNFKVLGDGIKRGDVLDALELEALAGMYYDKYHEEKTAAVTKEDIDKYIEDNKADFYQADYLKFTVSLEAEDYEDDADGFADAKELADKYLALMAAAKTEKAFREQVLRYIVDRDFDTQITKLVSAANKPADAVLATEKSNMLAELIKVLLDEETLPELATDATALEKELRKVLEALMSTCTTALDALEGQQAYVEEPEEDDDITPWLIKENATVGTTKTDDASDEDVYSKTVYMLTKALYIYDEETVNVGHILAEANKSSATEAELAAAKKEAEDILASFLAGEKTKDAFEALGEEKTDDSNVFYDNVAQGDMVTEFNDWIFDEARKEGDTAVVQTDYGFHVMYFVGQGENTSITAATEGIVDDLYTEFIKAGAESLKVNQKVVDKLSTATTAE